MSSYRSPSLDRGFSSCEYFKEIDRTRRLAAKLFRVARPVLGIRCLEDGRMRVERLLLAAAGLTLYSGSADAWIIETVGPNGQFPTINAAVNAQAAGHTYEIDVAAGTYQNDFSVITNPTDIEAKGGLVILQATVPNDQGIITTYATLIVNGLTISGAFTNPGAGDNAAAIRDHEDGSANANELLVENSTIENSQDGILTAGSGNKENVTVKNTTFLNDGAGNGSTHALYVGEAASLDVENSTFCGTNNGHDVKSRAATTTVAGSTLYIGATGPGCASAGSTGIGVDAPNGGVLKLVNDSLIQGPANTNGAMVSYGEEGVLFATNSLTAKSSFLSTANGLAIQELPTCITPANVTGSTFSGVRAKINQPNCISGDPPADVPEPSSLWLLLTALGCCAAFLAADGRRRRASAIAGFP
jgi:hypothetical protein